MSYAYFIRQAITDLRASGRGSIINISSTHAINPRAGMGQYDVTKAGIVSLTRTLAFEEAKHGICVNAVCPGLTLTPFHLRRAKAAGRSRQDLEPEPPHCQKSFQTKFPGMWPESIFEFRPPSPPGGLCPRLRLAPVQAAHFRPNDHDGLHALLPRYCAGTFVFF